MLAPVIEKSLQHYVAEARKVRKELDTCEDRRGIEELQEKYTKILDGIVDLFETK